jgi:hypothetical protein
MKTILPFSLLAAFLVAVITGCGDTASTVTADNMKAFESAPAEVQQAWRTALAASATNGYVLAVTTLRGMAAQQLSVPQIEAVQAAMRSISGKLTDAVARGDAAAIAAEKEIKAGAVRAR